MTNEERAAQIIGGLPYGERTSVIAAALKAAGLLTPDPEPKYRFGQVRRYTGILDRTATIEKDTEEVLRFSVMSLDAERACVLAALNAMEAE